MTTERVWHSGVSGRLCTPVAWRDMQLATVTSAFVVVFGFFVVGTAVLIVLTIRWTVRRDATLRRRWRSGTSGLVDPEEVGAHPAPPEREKIALVLAGGGTRGAAQVGMLQVLAERGFVPDLVLGASVGAINGAAFAGDPTPAGVARLARVWRGLRGAEVYPQKRIHGPWRFLQQRESVHPNDGLRRVIEAGITFERLEEAPVPFEVVTTSLVDGRERWFSTGPAVEPILASAAIPAIFPPVEVDGDLLIDGGVVDNVPIMRAVDAGATKIVVLLCGPLDYVPPESKRPVEAMLNALFIAIHARFAQDLARLPDGVDVIVMSAGGSGSRDYTDFSETEVLIEAGRAEATEVLRRHHLGPTLGLQAERLEDDRDALPVSDASRGLRSGSRVAPGPSASPSAGGDGPALSVAPPPDPRPATGRSRRIRRQARGTGPDPHPPEAVGTAGTSPG